MKKKGKKALLVLFLAPFLFGCVSNPFDDIEFGTYSSAEFNLTSCVNVDSRYQIIGSLKNTGDGYLVPSVRCTTYRLGVLPDNYDVNFDFDNQLIDCELIGPNKSVVVRGEESENFPTTSVRRKAYRGFSKLDDFATITFNPKLIDPYPETDLDNDYGLQNGMSDGYYKYGKFVYNYLINYDCNYTFSEDTYLIFEIEYEGEIHYAGLDTTSHYISASKEIDVNTAKINSAAVAICESSKAINDNSEWAIGMLLYLIIVALIFAFAISLIVFPAVFIPAVVRRRRRGK